MTVTTVLIRLASVITVGTVLRYFEMILGWVERKFAPSYMKERVNAGSDKFFANEEENWGRTGVGGLLRGEYDKH